MLRVVVDLGRFSEGLAAIKVGEKWGYIDNGGRLVIDPQFEQARPFQDGVGAVKRGRRWGFVDRAGVMVISPLFDKVGAFSNGLAVVKVGQRFGYLDKTGKLVITPQFADAGYFSDSLAPVQLGDKWGYIDRRGNVVISPKFAEAWEFSEGLAPVEVDGSWGYIDRLGKMIVSPRFYLADQFRNGLARVHLHGERWRWDRQGWIDRAGKYVWAPTILKTREYETPDDYYSRIMKSDLRNLVTAQEAYFADSNKYASQTSCGVAEGKATFCESSENNTPSITLTSDGWTASMTSKRTKKTCAIFVGSTALSPATKEGEPRCN
jgi:WG repeat protein